MLFYNLRAEIDRLHSEIIAIEMHNCSLAEFTAIRNQVNSAFERIHVNVACVERSVYESQCKGESRRGGLLDGST